MPGLGKEVPRDGGNNSIEFMHAVWFKYGTRTQRAKAGGTRAE
jgi:hypothetical protein